MNLPFLLPPLQQGDEIPEWTGTGFKVGDIQTKVLQYSSNNQGWTDELTSFHEDSAGEHHFIDQASRNHALSQIRNSITQNDSKIILEIGCSSGYMLKQMKQEFPNATILGADVVYEPLLKLADELPETPLFRFDLLKCPLPDNCVDIVVMLNVLEHIENDKRAIEEVWRILKPGGVFVLEVPAGPHLYDFYDKSLHHYRRYRTASLVQMLRNNSFNIEKKSHLGFFFYPGFATIKKHNQRKKSLTPEAQQQLVQKNIQDSGNNGLLHLLMKAELALGNYLSYPCGIRSLVTCCKG